MSRPTPPTCKTGSWQAYNEALKRRGSLTVWFDPEMIWQAAPTGKRGRQPDYSDAAIQTGLTLKVLFGMVDIGTPLVRVTMSTRQTTGFVESLPGLIGLPWAVPAFSTLSRPRKPLHVTIPYRGAQGPLHPLIDSKGIKVEGEGEWNARKHGGSKRWFLFLPHRGSTPAAPAVLRGQAASFALRRRPLIAQANDGTPSRCPVFTYG